MDHRLDLVARRRLGDATARRLVRLSGARARRLRRTSTHHQRRSSTVLPRGRWHCYRNLNMRRGMPSWDRTARPGKRSRDGDGGCVVEKGLGSAGDRRRHLLRGSDRSAAGAAETGVGALDVRLMRGAAVIFLLKSASTRCPAAQEARTRRGHADGSSVAATVGSMSRRRGHDGLGSMPSRRAAPMASTSLRTEAARAPRWKPAPPDAGAGEDRHSRR